jgi:hypothetical protein
VSPQKQEGCIEVRIGMERHQVCGRCTESFVVLDPDLHSMIDELLMDIRLGSGQVPLLLDTAAADIGSKDFHLVFEIVD